MKQLAKKVAIVGGAGHGGEPDQNERPCNGNSKHAGLQGGGACPHPHP